MARVGARWRNLHVHQLFQAWVTNLREGALRDELSADLAAEQKVITCHASISHAWT